jgi:hypothetical protein
MDTSSVLPPYANVSVRPLRSTMLVGRATTYLPVEGSASVWRYQVRSCGSFRVQVVEALRIVERFDGQVPVKVST